LAIVGFDVKPSNDVLLFNFISLFNISISNSQPSPMLQR